MSDNAVPKLPGYAQTIACPPDKSISVRAVILCSYAVGRSVVGNVSRCDDVMSAVDCMRRLGASIRFEGDAAVIDGAPLHSCEVDCGNSATTARLLAGLLSGLNGRFTLRGDSSLSVRPMRRVVDPLRLMGARIECGEGGTLPLEMIGAQLGGIEYHMPVCSAQVKSALLLAALNASQPVTVTERIKTRDHTENMIKTLGGKLRVNGNTVTCGRSVLHGADFTVPGDMSSAAYPIVLALCAGGRCEVRNVGLNKTRTGLIELLKNLGADITVTPRSGGDEPCGDISVRGGKLSPINIGADFVPSVIDEIPALCALACFIDGTSVIDGVGELRAKECDRIECTVRALKDLGADIEQTENGMRIRGGKPLRFGTVDPCGDHRIAMAAAVAAAAGGGATIKNAECVSVSYPSFFREVIGV